MVAEEGLDRVRHSYRRREAWMVSIVHARRTWCVDMDGRDWAVWAKAMRRSKLPFVAYWSPQKSEAVRAVA